MNRFKILLISCCCLLFSCSINPTFVEMTNNFEENESKFKELSDVACSIGEQQAGFSYRIAETTTDRDNSDFAGSIELEKILMKIGARSIVHRDFGSGQCGLTVVYFSRGFASAGIGYTYEFQKQNLNVVANEQSVLDEIFDKNIQTTIDVQLDHGWYFTIKVY